DPARARAEQAHHYRDADDGVDDRKPGADPRRGLRRRQRGAARNRAGVLAAGAARGRYPVETIEAMARICVEAEQTQPPNLEQDFLNRVFQRVDQSIAMAALFTAYHLKVKCIASLTESGSTALWMSRLNSGVPIYALTAQTSTRYKCALFRDVFPLMVKYVGHDREELLHEAEKALVDNKVVKEGDLIVLTIGEPIGKAGGTNTMKIVKVGEHRKS